MRQPLRLTWQKSSHSNEGVNCIHVAAAPDGTVRLRESADPQVTLSTNHDSLAAFLAAIKGPEARPPVRNR